MGASITTYYAKQTGLAEMDAAMAMLNGAKVGLLAALPALTEDLTYATLHAAPYLPTFDGYAASGAVTWSASYKRADGKIALDGGDQLFQASGLTTTNTIYGWYLYQPTGTHLLKVQLFDTPQEIGADILQGIVADVEFAWGD